ncbi:MAG: amidase, partial [Hyphomicrobiaceae bacterium]
RRLKAAGAVLVGKLSTWEYGTGNGGEYFDLPFPPARNPWDTERFTGGSSTGAGTSVAAGTAMFALGSDTTGSVRLPAAATGTVGIIPTPGRLSLEGILPNCYSLDIPGPFTWTVEDSAIVLDTLAERIASDPHGGIGLRRAISGGVAGMRIAVVSDPGQGMPSPDATMGRAFDEAVSAIQRLGAKIVEVVLPVPAAQCFSVTRIIGPAESAAIHEQELRQRPEEMGFALRDKLMAGAMVRAVDYIAAQRQRLLIANALDALMRGFDALVTFGALHVPPRLGVEPEMTAFTTDTMLTPFNLSAHPAMVQCTGFTPEGLPLHWQIVGNRGDEASIYRLAAAYEAATPWRDRRPAL